VEASNRRNIELWAFPAGTFLGTLFGLLVPAFGPPTRQYIVWLLVPLMVFSLLRIRRSELDDGLRRLDLLGAGLLALYIIVPLTLWGAGLAAGLSPELLFGVTLAALSPTIVLAPFFTDMIGGNRVLAAMISVVSTLLSPLLIPVILVALVGRTVSVPVGTIALTASALVGLPVLIALVLRKARPSLKDGPLPGERLATSVLFFFFMWGVIASSLGGINLLSMPLLLALAFLQEYAFFFGLRWSLGKMADRGRISLQNAKALALCIGIKNGALTAGIALTFSATVAMSSGLITLVSAPLFVVFGVFREKA
jgi:bile acid:Na+ symporter, BASS family